MSETLPSLLSFILLQAGFFYHHMSVGGDMPWDKIKSYKFRNFLVQFKLKFNLDKIESISNMNRNEKVNLKLKTKYIKFYNKKN